MYMFEDEIDIVGYISLAEKPGLDTENEARLLKVIAEICADVKKQIIICRHLEECPRAEIEKMEVQYGRDWIYAEDLFGLLDKKQLDIYIQGRKVVLWGAGKRASALLNNISFLECDFIVDSDEKKQGEKLRGKKISDPACLQGIVDKERYYILVTAPYQEVKETLERWGWEEGRQFADGTCFLTLPSALMREILHAPSLTTWQCHYPFEHLRITPGGQYAFCTFMDSQKINLGNAGYLDYGVYMNSVIWKLARLSVLNGTYVFCDSSRCSRLRTLVLKEKTCKIDYQYPILRADDFFQVASVDIDHSCNLYCCSCRNRIISDRGPWRQRLTDRVIEQILPNIDILFLAGSGEVFLSPYYKQILHARTFKHLKGIMILSNANICKRQEWDYITSLVNGNVEVSFSIDAGTKKTYEKIRRGGNFEKVEEHIRYVCGLKEEKRIKRVILNFVIQWENYKELETFVLWGKTMGVDYFNITFLDNWGTWTDEEFKKICMYEEGKKPLPELQEELDKLEKYGDCILLDNAVRYREMNYSLLMEG